MQSIQTAGRRSSPMLRAAQAFAATVLIVAGVLDAHASDTYSLGTKQLTIPSLAIGAATYSNVVVTVGEVLSGPMGTGPNGGVDTYDPATGQLTVQSVAVGGTTYFNVVVTVTQLVSIGSVAGADTFNGTYLRIPSVQAGGQNYANVTLGVSAANVLSIGHGLPQATQDEFDSAAGRLTIAAVQVGNQVYTNVVLSANLASVVAVGPTVAIAKVQADIFTPHCAKCHDGKDTQLPGSMNLSNASASTAALVNVTSDETNDLRVKRGDPLASYVIEKLQGAASIQGSRMPDGGPYLTAAQVEEVSAWILGL